MFAALSKMIYGENDLPIERVPSADSRWTEHEDDTWVVVLEVTK